MLHVARHVDLYGNMKVEKIPKMFVFFTTSIIELKKDETREGGVI
jgi:hypothetical protein